MAGLRLSGRALRRTGGVQFALRGEPPQGAQSRANWTAIVMRGVPCRTRPGNGLLNWRPLSAPCRHRPCTGPDRFCGPVGPAERPWEIRCHCMPGISTRRVLQMIFSFQPFRLTPVYDLKIPSTGSPPRRSDRGSTFVGSTTNLLLHDCTLAQAMQSLADQAQAMMSA